MSEPLDVKALRSLSKWLGREEDDGALVDAAADEVERLRVQVRILAAEGETYRAVIDNAPHAHQCDQFWELGKRAASRCTCWKADAL